MKKKWMAGLLIVVTLSAAACAKQPAAALEKVRPVKAVELREEVKDKVLSYTGIVKSEETKKLSFKSSGKLARILVKKGEAVKKGQVLAELDKTDLLFAAEASQNQFEAAKAQYDKAVNGAQPEDVKSLELNVKKAQDAWTYSQDSYKRIEALYEANAVSKNDLDKAKLDLDIKESELSQAQEAYNKTKNGTRTEDREAALNQMEQANADFQHKQSLVEDATIRSMAEGYVVDVLYEEGEMVSAGYPVIVVRNGSQVVSVGLSGDDIRQVRLGMTALIGGEGSEVEGAITNINPVPDEQTRTYPVEIAAAEAELLLGSIEKVKIRIGEEKGIWIPITSMLSDGEDYVYVIQEERAQKRTVAIEEIRGSSVKVSGVAAKDRLVVEGMTALKHGDRVTVLE